tara:strand:+ start:724 stop:1371 length:648 start_codon:yes stop_codon:yes gene_type:complete
MDHTISNLLRIKEEINLKESINTKIIAVTKTFTEEKILPLVKFGHVDFGENKVQEALSKWTKIKDDYKKVKLHMIGKLQTNKVKNAVKIFDYIHSVNSYKLAEKISIEQKKINKDLKLFIQINIGSEDQKNGIEINEVENFLKICTKDLNLCIIGIMCIPPNDSETEKYFSEMFEIKKKLSLDDLSMGMSNDYMSAIKFGSTFVRIGSKIFGQRN